MSWLLPTLDDVRQLRRRAGLFTDRHRPGYWREYYQRNLAHRRPYLAAKTRQYRRERRA
jgi:hypothetical protein